MYHGGAASHWPLVNVSRNREHTAKQDTASIQSAMTSMEDKILEKVSLLTISTEKEEEAATEVSFTADDIVGLTEPTTTCVGPSRGTTPLPSSPLRPRAKRSLIASPIPTTFNHELSCSFGPCRKKRRPGSLADAPKLPFDNEDDEEPSNAAFLLYDQRLERLVSRMKEDVSRSNSSSTVPSPISSSPPDDTTAANTLLPPVLSWIKPRASKDRRRGRRRHASLQHPPSFPYLSPRHQQQCDLTPLESLALEIEASPIVMPGFLP